MICLTFFSYLKTPVSAKPIPSMPPREKNLAYVVMKSRYPDCREKIPVNVKKNPISLLLLLRELLYKGKFIKTGKITGVNEEDIYEFIMEEGNK